MARSTKHTRVVHGRLELDGHAPAALDDAAEVYGRALRSCYAALSRDGNVNRKDIAAKLNIQYDYVEAALRQAKGLRDSVRTNLKRFIAESNDKADGCERSSEKKREQARRVKNPTRRLEKLQSAHWSMRRAARHRQRAERLNAELNRPAPRISFGSSKLFREQYSLEQSAHADHADWLAKWRDSRSNTLRAVGQSSKPTGNWAVRTQALGDGLYQLRIRLPSPCEAKHGKYVIASVRMPYKDGNRMLARALRDNRAITWNFQRDAKGWRATAAITEERKYRTEKGGAIGVDFNADHLAVAVIGADGNASPRNVMRLPMITYGQSTARVQDAIGAAVKRLVVEAVARRMPIVIEKLDFSKKKIVLRENGDARHARMLTGLACSKFAAMLKTRASRAGVRVIEVNPAFTSFIGRVRWANQLGLSVHHAAAIELARRGIRHAESAKPWLGRKISVPGRHDQVTFVAPDRMQRKHVWSWWGKAKTAWQRAHEAQLEAGKLARRTERQRASSAASLQEESKFLNLLTSSSPVTAGAELANAFG